MITFLKLTQLTTAFAVIALFLLIYPGIMALFATGVGIIYLLVSIGAILENRFAIWSALIFSVFTAALSAMGVNQFLRNGFDFLTGISGQTNNFDLIPYLFLAISIAATVVVVAHLASWHWLVSGHLKETK
ncbi:MAG: hypothetical protein DHS20C12_10510 [Pseudohongiella sp.]|nr:MAG: hypothetical protein DHS20C12_10510 [Pseudohongiella sp.]